METPKIKHFERPTSHRFSWPSGQRTAYLLVIVVVGILSGALGFVAFGSYFGAFNTIQYPATYSLTPKLVNPTNLINSSVDKTDQSLVSIFISTIRGTDAFDTLPEPSLYLGSGVLLTSDGWLVSGASELTLSGAYEVYKDGLYYMVKRIVFDTYSGLFFLKYDGANTSPVEVRNGFIDSGTALVGSSGSIYEPRYSFAYVGEDLFTPAARKQDYLVKTNELSSYVQLIEVASGATGLGYFDSDGKFVGVRAIKDGVPVLIPAGHIQRSFEQLLRNEEDVDLGITYFIDKVASSGDRYKHSFQPVIRSVYGSRAVQTGFLKEDVINSINGEKVSLNKPFDLLWRKYQHADQISISIIRDGQEKLLTLPN